MIRFGIAGCGAIHKTHVEALAKVEGAELVGAFDVVRERADAVGVKTFASFGRMLKEIDAVCICTPSGLHSKLGVQAAKAGVHVLVEKPIDTTARKARKLVETCREQGVKLTVISQHRFARDIQKLRHAIASGELGKPVSGDVSIKWYRTQAYYDNGDWRGTWQLDGGGCLINQGVHYTDMLQWVMGGVKAVRAQTRTAVHDIEVEDVAQALIEFENGAIGTLHASTSCFPGMKERIEVSGEHGTAILEGDRIKFWDSDPSAPANPSPYGRDLKYHPLPTASMFQDFSPEDEDPTARWDMQHRMQIQDFVDAIREDRDPFVTGENGLEALGVVLSVYRSAKNRGKRVEVKETIGA